jgi:hypothetical protein
MSNARPVVGKTPLVKTFGERGRVHRGNTDLRPRCDRSFSLVLREAWARGEPRAIVPGSLRLGAQPDKTRLIHFGRHAAKQREKLGERTPETFDFLGFTHFCTRSCKSLIDEILVVSTWESRKKP